MTEVTDVYKAPQAQLDMGRRTIEYTFASLGMGRKIVLVLLLILDGLFLVFSFGLLFFGGREFAFVLILAYIFLLVYVYKCTLKRQAGYLVLLAILHLFPGVNLLSFLLNISLAIGSYAEKRSAFLNTPWKRKNY